MQLDLDIIVTCISILLAASGFVWAIKSQQAVIVTRLDRIEDILLNSSNGVVQRLDRVEQGAAALEALCRERHGGNSGRRKPNAKT